MSQAWSVRIWSLAVVIGVVLVATPLLSFGDTVRPTPDHKEAALNVESSTDDVEERSFIGIELGSSTDGGIAVAGVIPNTAAERYGLQVGDVLVRIDEMPMDSPGSIASVLRSRRPGDTIEIELLRSGGRHKIRLELGVRPSDVELRRDQANHVLDVLKIRPGLDVADIGCGSGWLSEAIATELEGSGIVYAVEVDVDHVESLRRRALPGIVPVLSEPGNISLPAESLDIAMLHDVASHVAEDARGSFYESVARALRPGGRLAIFGPHGDAETMLEVLRANAFVPLDEKALLGLSAEDLDRRLAEGIMFRHAPESAVPER
jgi:SAM-dependent methyltransferase